MAVKTADQAAQRWLAGLSGAQATMEAGVDALTTAPGAAAAAKKQKWINALMDPAIQAKWANNVQAGGALEPWRTAMKTYGISRAIQGAQQKQAKFTTAMQSLLPFVYNLRQTVRSMPDNTPADREARMLAFVRGMRQYKRPAS